MKVSGAFGSAQLGPKDFATSNNALSTARRQANNRIRELPQGLPALLAGARHRQRRWWFKCVPPVQLSDCSLSRRGWLGQLVVQSVFIHEIVHLYIIRIRACCKLHELSADWGAK